MSQRTLETVLHPDGRLLLSGDQLPSHPVRILVTFLEVDDDQTLAEPGDYLQQLSEYEDRLARGEIQWR